MWRNWTMLAALGVIWGGSFTTVSFAVGSLPPLIVAAARLSIGATALIAIAYAIGVGLPRRAERGVWRTALAAAVIANAIPFFLLAWAQSHIPSGLAGVFMATLPLIVLPLAHVFVPGERMTWIRTIGFAIGFLGVIALIGVDLLSELGGAGVEVIAQLACLGAASGYAIGSIITKRGPPAHPISFGAATLGLAALMLAPVALATTPPWRLDWSWQAATAVLWLGLGPTALAMVMLYMLIRSAGPSFLSLVNYQVPVWAMLFGILLLDEDLPARAPAALALILAGVALTQLAGRRVALGAVRPPPP